MTFSNSKNQVTLIRKVFSKRVLDLHDERYFETLSAKYWNSSLLAACSIEDDGNEKITLDSLGMFVGKYVFYDILNLYCSLPGFCFD